ncbi:aminopeptidase P family protein [Mesorhizobium sp. M1A.T.Ca.IN.004.03.1.1]|uniref:M24 family metallopeptidase n=1 Tax=Mesorhizobium sp. M1A.T.Ca.IN.004.03.1.1 TaxID=2496795 RepID=UPI000FCB6A5A|nr:Xaa-Pro peptidase family protein [Mesorhizobium sp. M1A.T.Ca.IN.004.03.1.1]RUV41281.1 aminopeptidase P family protein [Mesorhizobium sp. M1A.T.Ca.IN.004.03.1.1]
MNELFSERAKTLLKTVDTNRMIVERRERLQSEMRKSGVSACIFFLPANVRYATGVSVMDVHCLAASERYCIVGATGDPILYEWEAALERSNKVVRDVRPALWWQYQGERGKRLIAQFVGETKQALRELGVEPNALIAVDRVDPSAVFALQKAGLNLVSASPVTDAAREIKTIDEAMLMRINGEIGRDMLSEFERAIVPGIREIDLLGVLTESLIRRDGIVVFTRLVSSGQNSNPWGTEASNKKVQDGELVALDTDATGFEGYVIDVSRTFMCGDVKPTDDQRHLYRLAKEQLIAMREAVRPGLCYAEFASMIPALPEKYRHQAYDSVVHGAGLMNEGPVIYQPWSDNNPHDRYLQENMVLCLEAYVGEVGGSCGVKLEDQVLVTKGGCELLVDFPFDDRLSA